MTKPRVQVDAFVIGAFMVLVTIAVFRFPGLFFESRGVRDICDVIGFFLIITGALLRMGGRGYKKHMSGQGNQLVTGGPYKLVRNPMYLGTFLVAVGFMFPLYPLWTIAIFACVFYFRFIIQIRKEEVWLREHFGKSYDIYCREVPSFFPTVKSFKSVRLNEVFPPQYLWTTKEKYGLMFWPVLSVILELVQEWTWGTVNFWPAIINIAIAAFLFIVFSWCAVREK